MGTLPEGVGYDVSLNYVERPTRTFIIDWPSKRVSGMDSGLAAMRQTVDTILRTERFKWQIYSSRFGGELEDLIGEEYDYIVSELPRRIEDAFSVDSRILSVEDFRFSEPGKDSISCSFNVVTVFGDFRKEVEL